MTHRRSLHLLATPLVLLLAMVGCTGEPPQRADGDASKGFAAQRLVWRGCGHGESFQAGEAVKGEPECVMLRVPTDYAKPTDSEQELAVARVQARSPRQGVLVVNPGGPGVPATASVTELADALPDELRNAYDLVVLDPRAVGWSGYLSCTDPRARTFTKPLDGTPDDDPERDALAAHLKRLGESCLQRQPALAGHVGTDELARDVDVLRSALGTERLDILGFSYGSLLAYEYARLFPDRLGRMVLDGVVVPGESPANAAKASAFAAEDALYNFVLGCVDEKCSLGKDEDAVYDTLDRLQKSLDSTPVPIPGRAAPDAVDESWFTSVLFTALYSPGIAADLPDAVAGLRKGDPTAFVKLSDALDDLPSGPSDNVEDGLYLGTTCLDRPRGEVTFDDRFTFEDASPTFGRMLATQAASCADWPVPARPLPKAKLPATTGAKALLVSNAADPATPREGADQVRELLPGSGHLRVQTWGHTAAFVGIDCVDTAVTAFLLHGTMPASSDCTP